MKEPKNVSRRITLRLTDSVWDYFENWCDMNDTDIKTQLEAYINLLVHDNKMKDLYK